jgi:hypothetical protein
MNARRERVTKSNTQTEVELRLSMALCGCGLPPLHCFALIFSHSSALTIVCTCHQQSAIISVLKSQTSGTHTEVELSVSIALRCCRLPPLHCFGLIFGHSSASSIAQTCHQHSISDWRQTIKRAVCDESQKRHRYRGCAAREPRPALLQPATTALPWTHLWPLLGLECSVHLPSALSNQLLATNQQTR